MVDGRMAAGPTQSSFTPGSVVGAELDVVGPGGVVPGTGVAAADAVGDGDAGVVAGEVGYAGEVGDAGGVGVGVGAVAVVAVVAVVPEGAGALEVLLLFGVHAVAARARPSTALAANFLEK